MAGREPLEVVFTYDSAGKDLLVYLICSGIATGSYDCQFAAADGSIMRKQGNIEKPEKCTIPVASAPQSIRVHIQSKSLFPEDPGTYHIVMQQEGRKEQQSPELVDDAELTVKLKPA